MISYNFWQKASLTDLLHYIDFFKWQHWPKWNKKPHMLNNKFNLIAVFLFVKDTRLSNFSFVMAVFAQCFSTNRLLLWAYAYTQFHFQQIMKVKNSNIDIVLSVPFFYVLKSVCFLFYYLLWLVHLNWSFAIIRVIFSWEKIPLH